MILFFTPLNNLNPEDVNQGAELALLLYEVSPILKENPNNVQIMTCTVELLGGIQPTGA